MTFECRLKFKGTGVLWVSLTPTNYRDYVGVCHNWNFEISVKNF